MASSGVWENIILSKTPTFDGVCGMLSFIKMSDYLPNIFVLLTNGKSTLCMLFMTDVIVIIFFYH